MKPIVINVTARDIKKGCPGRTHTCPIALAAMRRLRTIVEVQETKIYVIRLRRPVRTFAIPKPVQAFIRAFDEGRKVEPFRFTLGMEV